MSERYSIYRLYKYDNFAQHVEDATFPSRLIGTVVYKSHWYFQFRTKTIDGSTVIYPCVYSDADRRVQVRAYFNILRKDGSSTFETESHYLYMQSDQGCYGQYMNVEELLDNNNGYLDDGALTVEFGLNVNAVEGEDGIWMFNVFDEFFDWQSRNDTFAIFSPMYCHKQFINVHSTKSTRENSVWLPDDSFDLEDLKPCAQCVQITQGVRLQLTAEECEETIVHASYLGFFNTMRYCELMLIEMDKQPKFKIRNYRMAVKYDLRRYLVHLLKHIKTEKQLI